MKAHQCTTVELGTRYDREVMFKPSGILITSILRTTTQGGDFGTIWMWHDEAEELRDALNRYLHTSAPEPTVVEDTGRKK